MTSTTTMRVAYLTALALLVMAALAVATLAASAPAQANPSKTCSERGDTVYGSPLTHGGCTSAEASGGPTGASYSAQCKNLAAEHSGYPFTFYEPFGEFPVKNHGECVNTLRYLHTTYGG